VLDTFFRPFLIWLAVFELAARRRGWQGLTWMQGLPTRLLLALLVLPALRAQPRHLTTWVAAAIAAAPPAFLLHVGAASLRNQHLNPLRRLDPGVRLDRTIARVDIPMPEGAMPALYIVPRGETIGAALVLHGSGCDKTYYAWRMADALIQRGIAALLVDLDGHGESPRIQRYPQMLEDATVGVDWLRQRHGRVWLIGVSLGGNIAARAVADGLRVEALALLETPPFLHFTRDDMVREAMSLGEPFLMDLFGESTPYHLGYTVYDLVRVQSGPRIRCEIGTVDLIAALDLRGSLKHIAAPLLMIYGGRDSIVRPDQVALVSAALPPQAQLEVVPEASHLSLILHPGALERLGEWMGVNVRA
jgi:pimeloyl-ACP methyl ester carboxylesterase